MKRSGEMTKHSCCRIGLARGWCGRIRAAWDRLRGRIGGFAGCRMAVGVGCRIGPFGGGRMVGGGELGKGSAWIDEAVFKAVGGRQ